MDHDTVKFKSVCEMKNVLFLFFAIWLSGLAACKGDDASGGALKDGELDLKKIETVLQKYDTVALPVEVLKSGLPEKMLGMERMDFSGQSSQFMGLSIATAEASYTSEDSKLNINLIDTGGAGEALSRLASWADTKIDKQTEDGYERTVMIDGQKGFERYSKSSRSGELLVLAGDRLIISLTGSGIGPDDLRKGLSRIKLKPE